MHTQDPTMARAELLLGQNRPDLAEQHLRLALASDPNNARAHMLLAGCLRDREKFTEATDEARAAIGLAPDDPDGHWVLSTIFHERNMPREAMAAIDEAIRLWPASPRFWGQLAAIHIDAKRYREGLEATEKGLQLDPEDPACTNLRALALRGLGRREDSGDAVRSALSRNPEDPISHANMGWNLLHQSKPKEALVHFSEALRRNPELEWARQGVVEALRARWLPYRLMLRYFLFMSRLTSRTQWIIILGGYFAFRAGSSYAKAHPDIAPYLWPVLAAYIAFAISSWLAVPLFNLMLLLNRFGRMVLTKPERIGSLIFGALLLLCAVFLAAWLVTGQDGWDLAMWLTLPVAASAAVASATARARVIMWSWVGATAALALLLGASAYAIGLKAKTPPLFSLGIMALALMGFGSVWVANIAATMPAKKRS